MPVTGRKTCEPSFSYSPIYSKTSTVTGGGLYYQPDYFYTTYRSVVNFQSYYFERSFICITSHSRRIPVILMQPPPDSSEISLQDLICPETYHCLPYTVTFKSHIENFSWCLLQYTHFVATGHFHASY